MYWKTFDTVYVNGTTLWPMFPEVIQYPLATAPEYVINARGKQSKDIGKKYSMCY